MHFYVYIFDSRQYNISMNHFQTGRVSTNKNYFLMFLGRKGDSMIEQEIQGASVAWFKIAELIARREREKALGVCRLLAHSFPDRAYELQLEGDILWALEDTLAQERYTQAAQLYEQNERWIEAIALYEHITTIYTINYAALANLLFCYAMGNAYDLFTSQCNTLLHKTQTGMLSNTNYTTIMHQTCEKLQKYPTSHHTAWVNDFIQWAATK